MTPLPHDQPPRDADSPPFSSPQLVLQHTNSEWMAASLAQSGDAAIKIETIVPIRNDDADFETAW